MKKPQETYGTILEDLTYVTGVPEGEEHDIEKKFYFLIKIIHI